MQSVGKLLQRKLLFKIFSPSVTIVSSLHLKHGSLELTDALKLKFTNHLDPLSRSNARSVL